MHGKDREIHLIKIIMRFHVLHYLIYDANLDFFVFLGFNLQLMQIMSLLATNEQHLPYNLVFLYDTNEEKE
jgi:hypothetical protein